MRFSALLINDLIIWAKRPTTAVSMGFAVMVVVLGLIGASTRAPLFPAVLGGPAIAVVNGRIHAGSDGIWFVTSALFVTTSLNLIDVHDAWVDLMLVRGLSRIRWTMVRLVALMVGAMVFMGILVSVLGVALLIGWRHTPFITSTTAWDMGVWVLCLISLGWFAMALELWLGTTWWSLMITWLLLGVARFGGEVSPYIPFSQSIVALHHLPGTLGIRVGASYLGVWTMASGATVLWGSRHHRR